MPERFLSSTKHRKFCNLYTEAIECTLFEHSIVMNENLRVCRLFDGSPEVLFILRCRALCLRRIIKGTFFGAKRLREQSPL